MADLKANGEFQTVVIFDLETTGLFEGPSASHPLVPPRSIPGDVNRDIANVFRTYANIFDNSGEYPLPRITEIALVAIPRQVYREGVNRLHRKNAEVGRKKGELRIQIPTRVFVQQVNPELTQSEWKSYEEKQSSTLGFNLRRSDLECQPTFSQSWPLIHAFLSSLPAPVVMIGHNGLRFDCRVLLGELRRTNLLQSLPIPPSVHFMDSYLAFLDLEQRYHDDIQCVMNNINWKMITEVVVRKRLTEEDQKEVNRKRSKPLFENEGDRQVVNVSDDDENEALESPVKSLLRRPSISVEDSPPRDNQSFPNHGWKTAPSKLYNDIPTPEEFAQANPLNFMKTDSWPPAKKRRLRDEFFERKNDGNWNFSSAMANQYFHARGNFRLVRLYTDIISGLYNEHEAYADCVALLHVCLAFGNDFLNYIDKYSTRLLPLNGIDSS